MVDYKGAIWSPNSNFFPDTGKKSFLILHGTAGGSSAQEIASFFQGTEGGSEPVSSHYIVGKDGTVVQTVAEKDGAYGNGVVTNPNWSGNPNEYTISIEHVKSTSDNSEPLTSPQQSASFALIEDICIRNNIGMHDADDTTGITSHASIDPVNRSRCPGTYPWDELWAYLNGEQTMTQVPAGPTPAQINEALATWNMFFATIDKPAPPTGTGIYKSWFDQWTKGKIYGCPLSYEQGQKDWSGKPIVVQQFAGARCEWDGSPHWYGPAGKLN